MTTYTMKAKTGRLGLNFNRPPFDYEKLIKRMAIILIIILLGVMWLRWSDNNDNKLNKSFDTCQQMYKTYSLSTEYVPYMKDCMN